MLNLATDQALAAMLSIAIGVGAAAWLAWLGSKRRAAYQVTEAANQLRDRNKRIQAEIRLRMRGAL